MKRLSMLLMALPIIALLAGRCTPTVSGGDPGGSEITNGKVVAMKGVPASGISVDAYPDNYIQGKSSASSIISAVTGTDGTFELDIDSGAYNLFIIDALSRSGACLRDVGPEMDLGTITLDTLGSIAGTLHPADTIQADTVSVWLPLIVFSKGTPFRIDLHGNDSTFDIVNVPSGEYLVSIAKQSMTGCLPGHECTKPGIGNPLDDSVTVRAGATAVIDTVIHVNDIGELW